MGKVILNKVTIPQTDEEMITLYDKVLNGTVSRMPVGTWKYSEKHIDASRKRFNTCLKHLLETKLRIPRLEVPKVVRHTDFFNKYGLGTPLKVLADNKPYNILVQLYPDIEPWEIGYVKEEVFYEEEIVLKATNWLFITSLKYDKERLLNSDPIKIFRSSAWTNVPLWYLETIEDEIFNYHEGLAAIELVVAALPEYELKESDFKSYKKYRGIKQVYYNREESTWKNPKEKQQRSFR